jgi:anti-anti-sigma regulatory factor
MACLEFLYIFNRIIIKKHTIIALQILGKNGTFELNGNLNTTTSRSFITHFEYLINTFKNVTINIDKVKAIDASGTQALKTLAAISLKNNSILYIIGKDVKTFMPIIVKPLLPNNRKIVA